ncbi:hypothetical protein Golob_025059 [Gossypium lobatum]|uniref:Uncharacterized protein n=1 Tax=Gossypium lobatum TaxID=34289 RepID=A0A7J8ND66_9ROSI|nr:hypothetical protein [Gossypium lobatum]
MLLNDYLSKNTEMLQGCSMIELGSGVVPVVLILQNWAPFHRIEEIHGIHADILVEKKETKEFCSLTFLFLYRLLCITGMLCSRFCRQILMTDHNEEILRRNIELNVSSENPSCCAALEAEKLEWGNSDQINRILLKYPGEQLLKNRGRGHCKFILAYVSRAKMMDLMVISEATRHGMLINEVAGTRSMVGNLEGVIFEITLC